MRNHGIAVGKSAERTGEGRPLAAVADDELGEALEPLRGQFGGEHLQHPPERGAVLDELVHRARLRRAGDSGLGEAAAAGPAHPGALEEGD
ncbi:hypothetical protein [Streptomyces antibioticus]|uniref:Uncharacterized protein n=1 Tax=Streptomyces antibioticus TaxID=1890 RepID=A0ABX3LT91_STRAT|nr:hypothetical protein [Streptomyces antibioticus]OOQ55348.1 hypothetical protein AFM16_04940 [Streptomyces antibioticus]